MIDGEGQTVTRLIEENRDRIVAACRRHRVARLDVFGSALGDSFDPGRSDVDFLVAFEHMTPFERTDEYFALRRELESILNVRADVVLDGAVRNRYVAAAIDRSRQQLYAA